MAIEQILVPDIGGAESVDVIEVCVAVGDEISAEDDLLVLESDKASMDIPAPKGGKVVSIAVKEGDKLSEGSLILELEVGAAAPAIEAVAEAQVESTPAPVEAAAAVAPNVESVTAELAVSVPDIGGAEDVDVIEVCVAVGDTVAEGDSLLVLESDKASMDIPSPAAGTVLSLAVSEGDKLSHGSAILVLSSEATVPVSGPDTAPVVQLVEQTVVPKQINQRTNEIFPQEIHSQGSSVYAGPAARKLARQLGVDLNNVSASGPRGRIAKDDVKIFVKGIIQGGAKTAAVVATGAGIPAIPEVDFSKFGEIELKNMSKIKKLTAANMSRNWLNVPHVTQFDDADITELEAFRKGMKAEAEKAGVKLTPLPFLIKAVAAALRAEPSFNVSLHADGEHLVQKNYVHIGIAVDTPIGLMVPVIRDVDKKGLYEIAQEVMALAKKARDGKLMPKDMQGGCFTISSLGPMGGTGFTPIVNAPEVAILGVSKASIKPVWNGSEFMPRQMLPLCLSYDHRAINGSDAGRFFTYLSAVVGDIRKLLL
ncbi:MAG: pyruvate dehydrogenase E2 component (dihydrolipoamide acetyltransferase) [Flavobacteriales bacterium]|jgi:pyruvate dehydrogenase E2 component (dihydrolipoamide acetyltransferase)